MNTGRVPPPVMSIQGEYGMEKYAWKATIKEGCLEEYKRRHDALPADMQQLLRDAG